MSTPRKAYGWEKVLRCLLDGGGFYLSADTITERCGVKQPARRVHDLGKKPGLQIQSKYLDRDKGLYGYRLASFSREAAIALLNGDAPAEAAEEFPEALFDDSAPPKSTSHHEMENAA